MVRQLNQCGHGKKTKERTSKPYTEQGTNDELLLMFNRHGRSDERRICEPKYQLKCERIHIKL